MIDNIAELNRVLLSISALSNERQIADEHAVLKHCRHIVVEGRMPNHELTIVFSERIGFTRRKGKRIRLTHAGKVFLEMNPDQSYDLSGEQKRFVIRNCFLDGPLREPTRNCFRSFAPVYDEDTFRWSPIDSPAISGETWIVDHLRQLGVLKRHEEGLEVTKEYVTTIAAFSTEGKGWSEEEFLQYLKEKKEIGELAEELVLRFESERLRKLGLVAEAHCVRRISKLKTNAGYDIESFDNRASGMKFDRFIEVKGSRGPTVRFIWSPNEMEVAKKLGDNYWIYYQGGIDSKNKMAKNRVLLFQNPVKSILNNDRFLKTPNGLVVEARIKGEASV